MRFKILKWSVAIILSYSFLILYLGWNEQDFKGNNLIQDIILRRNYLVSALANQAQPRQFLKSQNVEFTGEWTLVTYSMAAFALTNIAMMDPKTAIESSKSIAQWIEMCMHPKGVLFDYAAWQEDPLSEEVLNKDEGHIGYYGHLNLMLGCYALLNNDGRFQDIHRKLSDAIARRMLKYPHRHVETYPGQNYPPDNTVSVASLRIADKVFEGRYKQIVDEWVDQTKKLEVTPYGLIPFQIDTLTGQPIQDARGSSNGWNTFFLPLIDEEYGHEQYRRLKKSMGRQIPGFAAVKEYFKGGWFAVDRDAGPVILGFGATATVFTIAGAQRFGDYSFRRDLLRSFELAAATITKKDQRRYALSPVLGDAITLAMKTACRWRPLWKE